MRRIEHAGIPLSLWVKYLALPSRLWGRSTADLIAQLEEAHRAFVRAANKIAEHRRNLRLQEGDLGSASDIVAHLVAADDAYAETLRRMNQPNPEPVNFDTYAPFAGSQGKNWPELIDRLAKSHSLLVASIQACPDRTRGHHPWFGPLSRREWTALATIHYRYHDRQLRDIAHNARERPPRDPTS